MNRPYLILPLFYAVIVLSVPGFNALARPYSDAERKATFIRMVQPVYPLEARRSRTEGTGLFRLYVDERGKVTEVAVLKSTGDKALDFESVRALQQWLARKGCGARSMCLCTLRFRAVALGITVWGKMDWAS